MQCRYPHVARPSAALLRHLLPRACTVHALLVLLVSLRFPAHAFQPSNCSCCRYRGAKIQLLDLPGIIEGAKDGKGRGRQVISTARTCNLIIIVLDCLKPITHKKLIEHELEGA